MAQPIVVIEPDARGNRSRLIFHTWSDENERLSTEIGESPASNASFSVVSREVPRSLTVTVECAGGLLVPKEGGEGQYQDVSQEQQVSSLKALRGQTVIVTTRSANFRGMLKTVEKTDDGKWDDSGIFVTLTIQVISTSQGGLKLGPDGLLLADVVQIQLAIPADPDDAPQDSGSKPEKTGPTSRPRTDEEIRLTNEMAQRTGALDRKPPFYNPGNETIDGTYFLQRAGLG